MGPKKANKSDVEFSEKSIGLLKELLLAISQNE